MLADKTADERQRIMLHGLFHRIQAELGFTPSNGLNEHLETLEGRVWMQLEWRALRRALESGGSDRAGAIADALAFRRERRRLFPGAADNERREEIREGLASYTGIAAWANSPADAHRAAAAALAGGDAQTSFVGNFEAASGPAYGVLLDDLLPGWRRQVRGTSDLGDMLASATNRPPTPDVAVAAARYDAATLRTAEEARDRTQQIRVAELRRRFVEGPVLTMPAAGSGTSDTTGSVGIPGAGTVFFRNFTLSAQWGRLKANSGVLSEIPTDRGFAGDNSGLEFLFRHFFAEATFKIDYYNSEGLPHLLSPLDPVFRCVSSGLGILGLHKYLSYRHWLRRELAGYVIEKLIDAQARRMPFWNPDFLESMAKDHVCGRKNYVSEINAVLTLEAVERLLFRERPYSLAGPNDFEPQDLPSVTVKQV